MRFNKYFKYLLIFVLSFFLFSINDLKAKEIVIDNFSIKDKSSTVEVESFKFENNNVTSNIKFNNISDYINFDLSIKNNESKKYKIASITDNNTNDNIKLSYSYSTSFIETGDISNIVIKMEYKNQLLNVENISLDNLTITVKLVDENNIEKDINVNPKTSDNIIIYVLIMVASLVLIIFLIKKFKKSGLFVIFFVMFMPLIMFALEEAKIDITFSSIDIKGEFEVYDILIDEENGNSYSVQVKYGDKIGDLNIPDKEGYDFDHWEDSDGNNLDSNTVITKEIKVLASYTPKRYRISYILNGMSATNPEYYTIEDTITLNNPTLQGYTFLGWTGSNGNIPQKDLVIPVGSIGDMEYNANFAPSTDTLYTVNHRKMDIGGNSYTLDYSEELHGTTGESVTAAVKTYEGFTSPEAQSVTILADGSAVLDYYYTRNQYAVTFVNPEYIDTEYTPKDYYYGEEIEVTAKTKQGYTFSKWNNNSTSTTTKYTVTGVTSIEAIYTPSTDTLYTVNHRKMDIGGNSYTLDYSEELHGTTGESVTPTVKTYEGFTSPEAQSVTILADGSAVLDYYYTRNQYAVTFVNSEYIDTLATPADYYYGEEIEVTAKTKQGYTFSKWSNNSTSTTTKYTVTGVTNIEALYTPNTNTPYRVIHKTLNADGITYTEVFNEVYYGTTDTSVTPEVPSYDYFISPESQTINIDPDGQAEVVYLYERVKYELTIEDESRVETTTPSGMYYYKQVLTLTAKDVDGYTFNKWSNNSTSKTIEVIMNGDVTIGPLYTPHNYTIAFNGNGGEGSMDSIDATYDVNVTLPENGFVKENYIIKEWNTQADGGGTSYNNLASVKNLTTSDNVTVVLYVIWKEHLPSYTHKDPITFDGHTIIDTNIKLFSNLNYQKNFEISFDIDDIPDERFEQTTDRDTIISSIDESGSPWPGTGFRINAGKYEFVGTGSSGTSKPKVERSLVNKTVKIIRIDEKLYYKIDNREPVFIIDLAGFTHQFDGTVTLGGALENGVPKSDRYFTGTISNISIKFISDETTIDDYSSLTTVYSHSGLYEFDGTTEKIITPTMNEGGEEVPVLLFSQENVKRDFEISFDINEYINSGQINQATLVNAKYENESVGYPGFAFRITGDNFQIAASYDSSTKKSIEVPGTATSVVIKRINEVLYISYNGGNFKTVLDYKDFTNYHNIPLILGGNTNASGELDRAIKIKVSNMVVKIGEKRD